MLVIFVYPAVSHSLPPCNTGKRQTFLHINPSFRHRSKTAPSACLLDHLLRTVPLDWLITQSILDTNQAHENSSISPPRPRAIC